MSYGTVQAEKMTTESGYSLGAGNASSFKNRLINGGMVIDQRNSATTPVQTGYSVDRWAMTATLGGKMSLGQSATAPVGFSNSLLATSLSAYPLGTNDTFGINQPIEGFNTADLGWGSSSAQAVTVSFWVRCSLTGSFGGAVINNGTNRSYTFNYTINAANTWEYKTVTIPGDQSGTWLTNNSKGVELRFGLGTTGVYAQAAGSWGTANAVQPSGCVSLVGTSGATFYITGVQLEVGTVATSFDFRSIGTELALCQRYYQFYSDKRYNGNLASASDIAMTPFNYPVTTRGTATVTIDTSPYSGDNNISALTAGYISSSGFSIQAQKSTSGYFYSRFNVTVANEL